MKFNKSMKFFIILSLLALLLTSLLFYGCKKGESKIEESSESEGEKSMDEFEWFQTGNDMAITKIRTRRSEELEDNLISDMYTLCQKAPSTTEENPEDFAGRINEAGLKRMRISLDFFDWCEVEEFGGPYSKHYIYPDQDKAITSLVKNGIKPIYALVFWDEEIKDGTSVDYSRFKTEGEIQRYLDFARFIVHNFKNKIEYYEILNEPNLAEGNQQDVKVDDYINLVRRTVPVIREEYPEAKIVVGAVTPLVDSNSYDYLLDILNSEIMPLVDGISWHVGAFSLEYEDWREYCINYPSIVQEIKEIASANGFTGEYMANELQWRTLDRTNPDEPWTYTDIVAAKYLARGIVANLGMGASAGLAECLECDYKVNVIRNLCTLMAGAEPIYLSIEVQSEETNIINYSFSLPNGDILTAVWTDGMAVNEDAGVKAELTIRNFTGQGVTGIDVLEGYKQDIITSDSDENLIIQNLVVRDYPLIIYIAKSGQEIL